MNVNTCHSAVHLEFSLALPWNCDLLLRPLHSSSSVLHSWESLCRYWVSWLQQLQISRKLFCVLLYSAETHRLNSALPVILSVISRFLKYYLLIFRSLRLYFLYLKLFVWGILTLSIFCAALLDLLILNFIFEWVHITESCQNECPLQTTYRAPLGFLKFLWICSFLLPLPWILT